MIGRRRFARLLLGALAVSALTVGPAEGDTYGAGTTFVARGAAITAADIGLVECNPDPVPSGGGACIPWSGGGSGIEVIDAVNGRNVAFQVCVDNDGDSFCGGVPTVAGCQDDIVFSHFDNGTFSNPLAAPTSFRSGCPGGFRGWVVFLCQGAHAAGTPHTHEVTTGTVTAVGGGGPSGEFCGAPLGKPYVSTRVTNGCVVQGSMNSGTMYTTGFGPAVTAMNFTLAFPFSQCLGGSVTASGKISGSCFAATGEGQFSTGHKFTFVWAGPTMELTPVGTFGAAGNLLLVPDPTAGQSCNTGSTQFLASGGLALR